MTYFGSKIKREIEHEGKEAWDKVMAFYRDGFLCDIKLTVGDVSRSAHRIVLSSLCPKGPWSNRKATSSSTPGDEPLQLDVSHVFKTPETFTAVIDYIYLGTIQLKTETVMQIIEVANELNVTDLIIHCSQFLLGHVRLGNVLSVWNLAYELELRQLAEVCRVLTRELFRDVLIDGDDMQILSSSFVEMLLDQKYITNTVKPTEIVRFILKWLIGGVEDRLPTARKLVSNVSICPFKLRQICDSVCENHNIESLNLQKRLFLETVPTGKHFQSQPDIEQNTSDRIPDADGGWMLMVRDGHSTTVYCRKSKTWLEFPNITNPYISSLSHGKYLACTQWYFSSSFQIINFSQPDSIEERQLIDDTIPGPKYIWYVGYKKKWNLVSLITVGGEYSLILQEWDDINSEYVVTRNFQTSISTRCIIKDFTYFNTDTHTLIVIIASLPNTPRQIVQLRDILYLFKVNWDEGLLIEEFIKNRVFHRCPSISIDQFMCHNDHLYVFENSLVKNLVQAIEYNVTITVPVVEISITGDGGRYKSIQLPKPGLNMLPLKPKSDQQKIPNTECPAALNSENSSGPTKSVRYSTANRSCVHVIDDKLFLVANRAPGIVQTYVIDIFQKSWECTPPLPLAALKDVKVNTFYSDDSLHKHFVAGKKQFESEDIFIFEEWCLQRWRGMGETLENYDSS